VHVKSKVGSWALPKYAKNAGVDEILSPLLPGPRTTGAPPSSLSSLLPFAGKFTQMINMNITTLAGTLGAGYLGWKALDSRTMIR
jgi:hypothetical protein